jgi:heptosyltransferase-1
MRVLLVRMSSLGDVLHTLPVAADIKRAYPQARLDWVVEEAYLPLLRMSRWVDHPLAIALRRWRRQPLTRSTWHEIRALRRALRAEPYDAIVDTQSLLKSAVVASVARGVRVGFSASACREPVAARFYHRRLAYPPVMDVHAVRRYRDLAAFALGYQPQGPPQYDLTVQPAPPPGLARSEPYALLFPSTARASKLWPESAWIELAHALTAAGLVPVIAWGSVLERARAERIAIAAGDGCVVAPRVLSLEAWAAAAAGAAVAVGLDTGLTYLAAAIGAPTVAIYVDTSPAQAGIEGQAAHRNLGDIRSPPEARDVIEAALALRR